MKLHKKKVRMFILNYQHEKIYLKKAQIILEIFILLTIVQRFPRFGGANANKENLIFIMEGPHNNLKNLPTSMNIS